MGVPGAPFFWAGACPRDHCTPLGQAVSTGLQQLLAVLVPGR